MEKKLIYILLILFSFNDSFSQEKINFGYFQKKKSIDTIVKPYVDSNTNLFDTLQRSSEGNDIDFMIIDDTIRIAVLLPFYSKINDSLQSISDRHKSKIYNRSEWSLKMLEGILLAVDSISSLGKCIRVSVFDTEKNSKLVNQLLHTDTLENIDIIFGPLYSDNFKILSRYYKNNPSKVLINPFSPHLSLLKDRPNVYSLVPSDRIIQDSIVSFVRELDKNVQIFRLKEEKMIFPHLKSLFQKDSIPVRSETFSSDENISIKKMKSYFTGSNNLLIIPSKEKSFVMKIIESLSALEDTIILIGMDNWRDFKDLNIDALMKLNVHVFSSNSIFALENERNDRVLDNFEQTYFHAPDKYSLIPYYGIMHFFLNESFYDFERFLKETNGYVNANVKCLQLKNYSWVLRK